MQHPFASNRNSTAYAIIIVFVNLYQALRVYTVHEQPWSGGSAQVDKCIINILSYHGSMPGRNLERRRLTRQNNKKEEE